MLVGFSYSAKNVQTDYTSASMAGKDFQIACYANNTTSSNVMKTLQSTVAPTINSNTGNINAKSMSINNVNVATTEYVDNAVANAGGGISEIPVATAETLGGIKVGDGLGITEDGILSVVGGSNTTINEYGCFEVSAPSSTTIGSALPITALEGNISVNGNGCIVLKANKVYSVRVSCRQAQFSANDGTACIKLDKSDGTEVARLINMYSISNNSMIYTGGVDRILNFAEDTEVRLSVLYWDKVTSVHDLTFTVIEEANVGGSAGITLDEMQEYVNNAIGGALNGSY